MKIFFSFVMFGTYEGGMGAPLTFFANDILELHEEPQDKNGIETIQNILRENYLKDNKSELYTMSKAEIINWKVLSEVAKQSDQ